MKKVALLFFLLSACGVGEIDDNYGYGYKYDYIDKKTGLKLRYDNVPHYSPISEFVRAYLEVQECTGLTAPGPLVIVMDKKLYDDDGFVALYYPDTQTILSPAHELTQSWGKYNSTKHEYIHHLLDLNAMFDVSDNHSSLFFQYCVY